MPIRVSLLVIAVALVAVVPAFAGEGGVIATMDEIRFRLPEAKGTVAWRDLIPVLPGPKAKPLGTPGDNPPSKLGGLWFGKWWYWGDYPAITFAIDEIRLEPTID